MIAFLEVSKRFGEQEVLREVSFRILPGERVGVVGPNGAGKSTLFALLTGELGADGGTIDLPRDVRFGYLRQQLDGHRVAISLLEYVEDARGDMRAIEQELDALTHRLSLAAPGLAAAAERQRDIARLGELQTRFEHAGGYDLRHRAEAALGGLGFAAAAMDRPFREFSGGWQMRAELARTLVAQPDLLLLDEPSNYLDLPAIEWLQRHLRDFAGTLVLISHDRYLLNTLTTVTLEVALGRVTRYPGNCTYYLQEREVRREQALARYKVQQRKRAQVEEFIERFRAKNTKAAQVQSRVAMLEKMEQIEVPELARTTGRIRIAEPPHCGSEIIRLEQAGVSYDGGASWVLRGVDLAVQRGDKTALVGLNGLGKSTLLRALAGARPLSEGRRQLGHQVVLGYQSQDFAETLPAGATAFEIVKAAGPAVPDQRVRTLLGSFGFSGDNAAKPSAVLSGGEKIRLAFARLLVNPPNFLLLDEPTTHLDMDARAALEEALAAYPGTLCFVSHDVQFVRRVATSILAMTPPGVTRYVGGYDYYLEKVAGAPVARSAVAHTEAAVAPGRERAERRQQRGRLQRQHEKAAAEAERQIDALHAEQERILGELAAQPAEVDFARAHQRLAAIQQEIAVATAAWETAAAALEQVAAD